jgi:hypothetical protein
MVNARVPILPPLGVCGRLVEEQGVLVLRVRERPQTQALIASDGLPARLRLNLVDEELEHAVAALAGLGPVEQLRELGEEFGRAILGREGGKDR